MLFSCRNQEVRYRLGLGHVWGRRRLHSRAAVKNISPLVFVTDAVFRAM
jgi:hypothetical protein